MAPLLCFSDLPVETVIHILSFLGLQDLLSFALTNRFYQSIYALTPSVQYQAALLEYGMIDAHTTLDTPTKLLPLKGRERRWRRISIRNSFDVVFQHRASSLYEIEGGFYISGETADHYSRNPVNATTGLRIFDIAGHGGFTTKVFRPTPGAPPSQLDIIDIGISLTELDLIVLVAKGNSDHSQRSTIGVHLLQFSTSNPHPFAKSPYMCLLDLCADSVAQEEASATVLVSGKNLVILLKRSIVPGSQTQPNTLFIIDWFEGIVLARKDDINQEIGDVAFLSHDLLIFPNIRTGRLEVARLPSSQTEVSLETVLILVLPYLRAGSRYRSAYCRSSNNPSDPKCERCGPWTRENRRSSASFSPDPEQAIILNRFSGEGYGGLESGVYWMIFRRSDMLRFVRAQLQKLDYSRRPPGIRDDLVIPWAEWGERLTRWRRDKDMTFWMTTSSGQRLAILCGSKVKLWDFNPHSVKKAKKDSSLPNSPENKVKVVDMPSVVRPRSREVRFFQDIVSGLPFVEHELELPHEFDGVHLDEEHLIAFNTEPNSNTIVQNLAVFPILG